MKAEEFLKKESVMITKWIEQNDVLYFTRETMFNFAEEYASAKNNENINFFNIEVGKRTKRNDFIKSHSFVCRTELDVLRANKHYKEKYDGFEVNCTPMNLIEDLTVPQPKKRFSSEKERAYKDKISTLERGINDLHKGSDVFIESFSLSEFPANIIGLIREITEKLKECDVIRREAKNVIISHLYEKYKPFVRSISINNGLSSDIRDRVDIKFELHGNLSKIIRTHKEEENGKE